MPSSLRSFLFFFRLLYLVTHGILLSLLHFLGSRATTSMHYRSALWPPLSQVVYAHLYAVLRLDKIYDITAPLFMSHTPLKTA